MILPYVKRQGIGLTPLFFWDNTGYALGADNKDPDRARQAFEVFRKFHADMCKDVDDEAVQAVLKFLAAWKPENAPTLENWKEMAGLNVVFQLDGERQYVHDRPVVKDLWTKYLAAEKTTEGFCLVTGQRKPIARIHPDIKGVDDAQTKGAAIVSFNLDAFCSYGKEQNYNAPVSIEAAAAYTAALNFLLRRHNNPQRVKIGDATTVFWTERDSPLEGFFGLVFDASEDTGQNESLRLFLEAVREGRMPGDVDPNMKFYILGLSPNIARLAVRFWHVSTVADISEKIGRYFRDIAIRKSFDNEPDFPSLQQLLRETAVLRKYDNVPSLLAAAMMRAILTGQPFPNNLLPILLDRIRAEQAGDYPNVNYFRACLLAGVLRRNHNQEVSMALDKSNQQTGYLLGRLFAVLERIQERSAGHDINATIRDRYYSAASATPVTAFPILMRLKNHHLAKLENRGEAANFEKLIGEITAGIAGGFPPHLSMEQQGLFALGYYHQRQDFFDKLQTNKQEE
jgi:CRISPR-associated protein Csd1